MGSPIALFIVPNCGLEIKVIENVLSKQQDLPLKYEITKPLRFRGMKPLEGFMSPKQDITLPKEIKKKIGIRDDAKKFAFIHPPAGLADLNKREEFELQSKPAADYTDLKKCINTWAIPYIAMIGGYAYFDKNDEVICVNALSLSETRYPFSLAGPFKTTDKACHNLRRLNRIQPILLEAFYEVNFVAMASILPNEEFDSESVCDDHQNIHGAFTFFQDNGTSVTYTIEENEYVESNGDICAIRDIFFMQRADFREDIRFLTSKDVEYLRNDEHSCRSLTDVSTDGSINEKERYEELCWAINKKIDVRLSWTPLHYICRFHPKEVEIIKLLIEKNPESVHQTDKVGRQPIHIACDSEAPEETIRMLLKADPEKKSIRQETTFLGRLPIHIACDSNNLTYEVLSLLIDADESKTSVSAKTRCRSYLPLHLAIRKKCSLEIIKLLLDSGSYGHINEKCDGMIPLHIACWNNSSLETVKLLLETDKKGETIFMSCTPVDCRLLKSVLESDSESERSCKSAETNSGTSRSIPFCCVKNTSDNNMSDYVEMKNDRGTSRFIPFCCVKDTSDGNTSHHIEMKQRSLHLAMRHRNTPILSLLLRKERATKESTIGAHNESNLLFTDAKGRCPLHIACKHNVDLVIVKVLLDMDSKRETVYADDHRKWKPIHYACNNKEAKPEIVRLLLEAENRFPNNKKERTTHSLDQFGRSPLNLAVNADAPASVIEMLLKDDQFNLDGFDNDLLARLANMCSKHTNLQNKVVKKLSERYYFSLLLVDAYTHICALVTFIIASEQLLDGKSYQIPPVILFCCTLVFLLRGWMQILAQGYNSFSAIWCWVRFGTIILLILSTRHMLENIDVDVPEVQQNLLITTGVLLIVQFLFFLRSTFLPFANFVGGLMLILHTLVPFFIVSFLILWFFAYSYRLSRRGCIDFTECFNLVLQGFFSGADQTEDFLDVLFGILAIIILLNVLIAIVSNSWESAQDEGVNLFWKFRLEFLSESRISGWFNDRIKNKLFTKIGKCIDKTGNVANKDNTEWSKEPFDVVVKRSEYENPNDYFYPELAKKIKSAQSLQAALYWTMRYHRNEKKKGKEKETSEEDEKGYIGNLYLDCCVTILKWVLSLIRYVILFVLGLVTAGLFWPRPLRCYILSVGVEKTK